ncbi:uncharacterized protein GLRG_00309 [Colletotrichum graminicola M1.001]|uniref:Aminoglycoside phosphotransferase domain-containing protein n=1 Tax=Colletotrichum graminicola (strain M1.001 / M2 / FGSC 10212) TaxID=645133 RepID=E3Q264_COLGM|nr:uncharacterized protein GLRG_00309 [Colletotrichum graminicola M1.001]EFQ25165.1 hypothetical protein GLRG_00309 [Colletotrichum graminicola M1.001]
MDSAKQRLSKKAKTIVLKALPRERLASRLSQCLDAALASIKGIPLDLPDRVPPPSPLSPVATIPDQTPLSTEAYRASRDRYVRWTPLRNGEYAADWASGCVPTEADVHRMLSWYNTYGVYEFPAVEYVSLIGRGRTNYFFLVEFVPAARPCGRLPQKVVLKFSLPVCPHEKLETEVATMVWAAAATSSSSPSSSSPRLVPRVLAFDSYPRNPLGLEWMMMEPVSGFPLQEYELQGSTDTGLEGFGFPWKTPPQSDKDLMNIGEGIRDFMAKIKVTASGTPKDNCLIGSLRINWQTKSFYTGSIVSPHFYSADRLWRKPVHGPYASVQSYLEDYLSVWRDEYVNDEYMQKRLASLDIVVGRMAKRLEMLPDVKWRLPTDGGRMNGWPVTISHPDPRPNNVLVGEDDRFFQRFGCEYVIDPMQIDMGCALPPRAELLDRVLSRAWPGREASIVLEPVMESTSGIETAFKALMEVCERLPLRRETERVWLDKAVLAMMDQYGQDCTK